MSGVSFATLHRITTPETSAAARELITVQERFAEARSAAEELLARRNNGLSAEEFHDLRSAVRANGVPKLNSSRHPDLVAYANAARDLAASTTRAEEILTAELDKARAALLECAGEILPRYLVFAATGAAKLLAESISSQTSTLPPRNKRARERERHLLLYLQRIVAKNDTFSEFGPAGWGRVDSETSGKDPVTIDLHPGIAARQAFLERWTARTAAAAINSDPDVLPELSPRRHPNGRIENGRFIFTDVGQSVELDSSQLELVERCDGAMPVHALSASLETIRALKSAGVLRCEMEVPALEPNAFTVLRDDVARWRPGSEREKWLSILQPIVDLPEQFVGRTAIEDRHRILLDAKSRLEALGEHKAGDRFLYSATNPIGEECFRECGFSISEKLINEVTVEAAPWIDLWRDSYAFVASRVADGLGRVLEKLPMPVDGAVPLPAFLRACDDGKLSLTGPGLVALAHIAFQEVKSAFNTMMKAHSEKAEYQLTADDCHVVRKNFQYADFEEYTYPSADLQLSAESVQAVSRGDYQWILAELHPPVALLHHGGYWSCPDKSSLSAALTKTVNGRPNFHFGFFAADFTSHTTVRLFDALPKFSNYVAPQRANPGWRTIAPAETEVYLDNGDVCLRHRKTHEYLGSFARNWIIPLGFHPFQFGMSPHTPRLRCGRVIVQRRAWTVTADELGTGNFTGVSRDLLVAIERLRAHRDLPRYIYIRPTEHALRRSGAEGRDKDTKPIFIDLESYLFLEIFHRWLVKAGEIEVTEMLPDPDHLLWKESDGRRTFELRTLIVPRK